MNNPFQFKPAEGAAPAAPAAPAQAPQAAPMRPPLAIAAPAQYAAPPQAQAPAAAPRAFVARQFNGAAVAAGQMSGARFPFLLEGDYLLRVERTLVTTRNGAFVAELKVEWSNNPERVVGKICSWVQGTQRNQEVAFGTIKRFAASVAGCETEDELNARGVDLASLLNAAAEPDHQIPGCAFGPNPMKGALICCRVLTILTKDNKPFTRHDFSPYVAPADPQQ